MPRGRLWCIAPLAATSGATPPASGPRLVHDEARGGRCSGVRRVEHVTGADGGSPSGPKGTRGHGTAMTRAPGIMQLSVGRVIRARAIAVQALRGAATSGSPKGKRVQSNDEV